MGKTGRRGGKGDRSDGSVVGGGASKLYLEPPLLELGVPEPELLFITDLPGGLDQQEWIASHTIGFFEHINLMYGTVSEFCTQTSCPEMQGPGPRTYMWVDDKGKKSKLSAPQYIDYVMTYVQKTINDENIFPTKHGIDFPTSFLSNVHKVHRLLFHVLAHLYHAHFKEVVLLQLHAHLNAVFAHFVQFNSKFNMVDEKELEVLDDLILSLHLLPCTTDNAPNEEEREEDNKENIEAQQDDLQDHEMEEVICSQPVQAVEFPREEDQQEQNNVEMTTIEQ